MMLRGEPNPGGGFLMGWPVAADKKDMEMCRTWTCPGCGALIGLPAVTPHPIDLQAEKRLDQLAQAMCGCWVRTLSDRSMAKLLGAIVSVDEPRCSRVIAMRRF